MPLPYSTKFSFRVSQLTHSLPTSSSSTNQPSAEEIGKVKEAIFTLLSIDMFVLSEHQKDQAYSAL